MGIGVSIGLACAICGAAEQSIPASGVEVPFEGRKRATLELRAASFETTARDLRIVELRAEPGLAAAFGARTLVSADMPLLRRTLTVEDGGAATSSTAMSVGDVDIRATHTAWRSAPSSSLARRLTVGAGVKLPTAPSETDPAGRPVPPDLQPGCGAIVPLVTLGYAWRSSLWSLSASASLLFPVSVRAGAHPGDSLRTSLTMQLQPSRVFATRLGAYGRLDGSAELDGEAVRGSGGASLHVAPELVVRPVGDVVVAVGASFPLVQGMRAYRVTAPVLLASLGVDF